MEENYQDLQTGAVLRIADACELMAKNFLDMQRKANALAQYIEILNEELKMVNRSNAALKGQITKLKRKCKTKL